MELLDPEAFRRSDGPKVANLGKVTPRLWSNISLELNVLQLLLVKNGY